MKVSTFRSVGAKLFYYMSLLVLITIAGNSYQYFRTFKDYQTEQIHDTIQQQAERAGTQFESTVETWASQITVALPTLKVSTPDPKATEKDKGTADKASADGTLGNDGLKRFVDANREFIAIELLSAPNAQSTKFTPVGRAFTSDATNRNFDGNEPAAVAKRLHTLSSDWLKKQIEPLLHKKDKIAIESVASSTKLPILLTAVRFDVAGSQSVLWAVLATWQTNLIKALPKSNFIDSALVYSKGDNKGQVFTSPSLDDTVKRRKFGGAPLVREATKGDKPAGVVEEYKTPDGRRIGAFYRLGKYDLVVLVQMDAEFAYQALKKNLLKTSLWAILFILAAVMFSFFGAAGITKGLRAVTYATGRIAAGDLRYQIALPTKDEVGALGAAVNHMSKKIVELMQSQVDKARFEKELETARMVQSTFFPKQDIKGKDLVVTGFYQPASECGGDLWGHCEIEPGLDFIFIADAMGHGAPAALVTAMAYSTTMTIADIIRSEPGFRQSPAKILDRLNRIIFDAVRGSISMTFFASIIDTNRGLLTFANAGHNFPAVVPLNPGDPRSGRVSRQAARTGGIQPISLRMMGTPLGMDPKTEYKEQTFELKAGDKLFFFTDGLIECSSPTGEVWGRKFLLEQVAEAARLNAEEMKDEVLGKAFQFFANKPLDDDVTVVVAEIARDWKAKPRAPPAAITVEAAAVSMTPAPAPSTPAPAPVAEAASPVLVTPPPRVPAPPLVVPNTVAANPFVPGANRQAVAASATAPAPASLTPTSLHISEPSPEPLAPATIDIFAPALDLDLAMVTTPQENVEPVGQLSRELDPNLDPSLDLALNQGPIQTTPPVMQPVMQQQPAASATAKSIPPKSGKYKIKLPSAG